MVQITI